MANKYMPVRALSHKGKFDRIIERLKYSQPNHLFIWGHVANLLGVTKEEAIEILWDHEFGQPDQVKVGAGKRTFVP